MQTIAIMQPYVFPYLGYFNLIHASSTFVLLDDAQYIRNGWVNRNRMQTKENPVFFTVPLAKSHQKSTICEKLIAEEEYNHFKKKLFAFLKNNYAKAPYYAKVTEIIRQVFDSREKKISRLAELSLNVVLEYIGLQRKIIPASSLPDLKKGTLLRGEDRIIHIAKSLGGECYVNAPGGKSYYSKANFSRNNLKLMFVIPAMPTYEKSNTFINGLSILDILMYVPPHQVLKMARDYTLETN
ncbi:WbqC family protein [Maridesulfovibrio sp.]|uniref:WbqC family protein n=1 Tax=Maridesulfovibrio sp. TaxID=2795000 RepID=UPI0039EF6069